MLNNYPVVQLSAVNKVYRRGSEDIYALRNVNLELTRGDFVSIIGPSGSGKTTLLNLIGCLDTASSGTVKIDGEETTAMGEKELVKIRREKIGFVFQQFYLIPGLSVRENIALPLIFSGKEIDNARMNGLLDTVGLPRRADHKPNQLSGGEMQRVAIARALVNDPQIILADEPTGNLDLKNKKKMFKLLRSLNEQGLTIVLVTHDLQAAEESGIVLSMTDGTLERVANANDYFCQAN